MRWDVFCNFGVTYLGMQTDHDQIIEFLCNGDHAVVLNVVNNSHWVLARGVGSNSFDVYDPKFEKD